MQSRDSQDASKSIRQHSIELLLRLKEKFIALDAYQYHVIKEIIILLMLLAWELSWEKCPQNVKTFIENSTNIKTYSLSLNENSFSLLKSFNVTIHLSNVNFKIIISTL